MCLLQLAFTELNLNFELTVALRLQKHGLVLVEVLYIDPDVATAGTRCKAAQCEGTRLHIVARDVASYQ